MNEGEIPTRRQTATGEWETALTSISHLAIRPAVDEARLNLLAQRTPIGTLTWEARLVALAPMAGEKGGDDYWARVLLCVDHASGFIFGTNVLGPRDTVQDAFIEAMERAEHVPEGLLLTSRLLELELSGITQALGIEVELVEELPGVDEAEAAMKAAFRR